MSHFNYQLLWMAVFGWFATFGFAHDGDLDVNLMSEDELIEHLEREFEVQNVPNEGTNVIEWNREPGESFEAAVGRLARHLISDKGDSYATRFTREVLLVLGLHKSTGEQSIEFIRQATNEAYDELLEALNAEATDPGGKKVIQRSFTGEKILVLLC